MPALPPPGMQIGGPEPGTMPAYYTGPEAFAGQQPGTAFTPASIIQQVSAATTVVTPASLTVNFTSTGAGNTLLVLLASAGTGTAQVFSGPAGWKGVTGAGGGNAANTMGCAILIYPGGAAAGAQPGGLTSAVFSVTNANGIAAAFYEFDDAVVSGAFDTLYSGTPGSQNFANSSTGQALTSYTPATGPVLFIGAECDVTGQAYTAANLGPGWVTDSTATSTTGATLVVIRPFHVITSPAGGILYQLTGSLAGAIANGSFGVSLQLASTGNVFGGSNASQAVGQGDGRYIGDGPCPKPGGAGGGQ